MLPPSMHFEAEEMYHGTCPERRVLLRGRGVHFPRRGLEKLRQGLPHATPDTAPSPRSHATSSRTASYS